MEARGRGILLLHDIQPATALALPEILQELKARGFKIVHVVPATDNQPKTATEPQQWVARHTPERSIWPRTLVVGLEEPESALAAPNPASFGIETFGPVTRIAMAQTFERRVAHDGAPLLPVTVWPRAVAYSVPHSAALLPVPGAQNFSYSRPFHLGAPEKPKFASRRHPAATSGKPKEAAGGPFGLWPANSRRQQRAVGHQLNVARSPLNLNAPQAR